MTATDHVVVFDENRDRASTISRLVEGCRPWADPRAVRIYHDLKELGDYLPAPGLQDLRGGSVALAIVVEAEESKTAFPGLPELARSQGVATLLVVKASGDPARLMSSLKNADGWMTVESIERELPIRAAEILDRCDEKARHGEFPKIDPKFLALVVHDLRTPLNVIGLTIRAITQTVPNRSAELDEDLTFLKENAAQIEKMLTQLGDYCRLMEGGTRLMAAEFDPQRFLTDFLEYHRARPGSDTPPIRLELAETSPIEVSLDQNRVKLALQHALSNTINAAGKTPIRLRSSGEPDRWVLELIVDKPPPQTVVSKTLSPAHFERLAGSAAERRGLDLAIAAHVSELFGGSARLVVEPDRRSTIVLDWPQRMTTG